MNFFMNSLQYLIIQRKTNGFFFQIYSLYCLINYKGSKGFLLEKTSNYSYFFDFFNVFCLYVLGFERKIFLKIRKITALSGMKENLKKTSLSYIIIKNIYNNKYIEFFRDLDKKDEKDENS